MKTSSKENMNSVEMEVGSLWKESFNNNDAHSDVQEEEVMELENVENNMLAFVKSIGIMGPEIAINVGKPTCRIIKWDGSSHFREEYGAESDAGCPSKFLMMCLNSIQSALQQNDDFSTEGDRPFFANPWGFEFWICYTSGIDVLEIDGADSKMEKIAWIMSTAADTISMKEKVGLSFNSPFLLYLVPSKGEAYKVRRVCKLLQTVGICTLNLHSGASIDLQINSLKNSEPEFVVSTPERLLELLFLKAIDISDLSLMVIDGLEAPFKGTYLDAVKYIRQFISGHPQTVVFCDCKNDSSVPVCTKAAGDSACR